MDFSSFSNVIDGKLRRAKTTYHGINPSTEEQLYEAPVASEADLNDTVTSARNAFPSWSQTSYERRCELVRKYAEAFIAQEDGFMDLLMKETGKPKDVANREIHSSYEGMIQATKWTLPLETLEDENKTATVRYVPLGVVGAICPWNYPLVLSFTKIAPALVTGNCVIVKPSPYTPYTTLKAVEVGHALFPPGVLQVLGGDEQLGPWIVSHPDIQKISFTGSIPTGKKIMEECAKTLKRVTLELGGNDAAIICPDVDIEKTAPAVITAAFKNSGQICVASKRIYIHRSIYTPFLTAMTTHAATLTLGSPFSPTTTLGPLQNAMQYAKVRSLLTDCKTRGYEFATTTDEDSLPSKGYFIPPTLISNPPSTSLIMTSEQFGPILPVQPWPDEDDVVRRTNDTKTGLGACIWSKDLEVAERIARRLEVRSVYINSALRPDWRVWFAGQKESGIGGERGARGLLEYCNAQAVHVYR